MTPIRDDQRFYNEIISLYSAREKGLYSEDGGFYDQPNCYNKLMSIVDSSISESLDMEQEQREADQREIDSLRNMGLNVTSKKS